MRVVKAASDKKVECLCFYPCHINPHSLKVLMLGYIYIYMDKISINYNSLGDSVFFLGIVKDESFR